MKMKVSIEHKGSNETGQVVIKYKDMDELDTICRVLSSA